MKVIIEDFVDINLETKVFDNSKIIANDCFIASTLT